MVEEFRECYPKEQFDRLVKVVKPKEIADLEPRLTSQVPHLAGGVWCIADKTVCSHTFCTALRENLEQSGVRFALGSEMTKLSGEGSKATLALSNGDKVVADGVVLAAGVGTGDLLRKLQVTGAPPVPLYPMRGHSMTVDVSDLETGGEDHVLRRSVCNGDTMTFFSPLPSTPGAPSRKLLRLAAFGDFDGWGYGPEAVRPWRLDQILEATEPLGAELVPSAAREAAKTGAVQKSGYGALCPEEDPATRWCGLRPMSPDGLPVVGRVGSAGSAPIFVNCGHGALGWTLSAGTASIVAEQAAAAVRAPGTRASPLAPVAPRLCPSRFTWQAVARAASKMYLRR
mmetsp:Transcript_117075/g.268753  ORF Transcript_117075/g.268753 Transcript_117075/m.268753 type:complete len:342 (+) Transcript_117075:474-1499(+)